MQKIYFVSLALNKTDIYRAAKDRIKKSAPIYGVLLILNA